MGKLSEEATFILDKKGLQLHCEAAPSATGHLRCYSQLNPSELWSSFTIESRANNVIGLRCNLGTLLHALKGGLTAHSVAVKLTKKGQAKYLAFSMDVVQDVGLVINHDVPVRVLAETQLAEYKEPELPPTIGSTALPDVKKLKSLVERLKSFSPGEVSFEIRYDGTLCISINTTDTAIKAFYPNMADRCSENEDAKKISVGCQGLKKAIDAFSLYNRPTELVAGMCPPTAFVINCSVDAVGSVFVLLPLKNTEE